MSVKLIQNGDVVFVSGGGANRCVEVKKGLKAYLPRTGAIHVESLIGMRYGEVVSLDHKTKRFVATNEYPDLDLTDIQHDFTDDSNDNRNLLDDNTSQAISPEEVEAIRKEKGLDELLTTLVEKSASFVGKTTFAREKYLKRKKHKFATLYKIEQVFPDNLAETHIPTISPSDNLPDDTKNTRLRVDTVAFILQQANIMHDSRVLLSDTSNGVLPAYILSRMGADGRLFHALRHPGQPNTYTALRVMQLPDVKTRWRAVPRNEGFLAGIEEPEREAKGAAREREPSRGPSQWMKGTAARTELLADPADSLIIVAEDDPEGVLDELFPFLAFGGHVVIYSVFFDDLVPLFARLRNSGCVNVRASETWFRYHQVLPRRTHPTVNMSTAGGYLLTAIKVQPKTAEGGTASTDVALGEKRAREEEDEGAVAE